MKHEDNFEAFMLRINPPQSMPSTDAPIRPYPRFASLPEFTQGEGFVATIPTVRRSWWVVGLLGIAALWFTFVPIGIGWGFVDGFYDNRGRWSAGYYNPIPLLIAIGVLVAVSYVILRAIFPRIKITADRSEIRVGKFRYDWNTAAGMRVGYSIGGVERSSEQGFLWFKYTGMRMAYGQWGHDLPYMVSNYYSVAYAAWINQLLETVELNTETVNNPAAGIKQELY